jgi:serine/threonine-protein kinase RsbW
MKPDKPAKRTMLIDSNADALDGPRQWLLSQLQQFDYGDDDVFAIHLAFQEAFYNAIRHGSKMDSQKQVKIECLVASDRVEISMTDSGSGFDPNTVPDCRVGENLYKTEGRGLLLMRSYMDVVEYNEVGNSVHMVRRRHTANSPASNIQR